MSDLAGLLKSVKELELVARKNAYSLLSGEYVTTLPGKGLLFHEARKYVLGEPIRMIDWNMTARLGEPYVKVFQDEREREVFVCLDVSPSMYSGWQEKTKLEYAIEMAATLAVSTIQSRDKLGFIIFNDKTLEVVRPQAGKIQLFRALKAFLKYSEMEEAPFCEQSDIRAAIHGVQQFQGKRFIIFILSDFIDQDVPDDLKYIRAVHDLNLLHIYDPFEYTYSKEVFFDAYAPEGERRDYSIYPGEPDSLESIRKYLDDECKRFRLSFGSFSTKEPVDRCLRELFHNKRKSLV
ncbi:MAG: DUF58 domain-containing protein [Leptospiraceae bacterium]|nr:DUF58 domain-containing protein [Leptospiraceae bacterium]MCP5502061.1 DUF58 domain-containing protein [Leptospiraceae bacterium]